MTGFGDGRGQDDRLDVTVEVRAVNNRYLKLLSKIPDRYQCLEPEIERIVRESISRGTVNVVLRVDSIASAADYRLDAEVLRTYWQQLLHMSRALDTSPPRDLSSLLALPGVATEGDDSPLDAEGDWPLIESTVRQALEKFHQFRRVEGESMAADLLVNLRLLASELEKIAVMGPRMIVDFRDRLHDRVKDLLRDTQATVEPADLIREVSMFAERCDISEEITRLRSHIDQFESFVAQPQSLGRKLEFLTQEMGREVNTIGSKANSSEITHGVVEMKVAVERIREVLQNVE
jgi:uncharacterized protein (TIGR00255 family)